MTSRKYKLDLDALTSYMETRGEFRYSDLVAICGVTTRTIARWRAGGGFIPWDSADEAATSLGCHPTDIWGEAWRDLDYLLLHGDEDDPAFKKLNAEVDAAMERIGVVLAQQAGTVVAHERISA